MATPDNAPYKEAQRGAARRAATIRVPSRETLRPGSVIRYRKGTYVRQPNGSLLRCIDSGAAVLPPEGGSHEAKA